jgi:hypothetical protein
MNAFYGCSVVLISIYGLLFIIENLKKKRIKLNNGAFIFEEKFFLLKS